MCRNWAPNQSDQSLLTVEQRKIAGYYKDISYRTFKLTLSKPKITTFCGV